ncbi:MAG: Trm112 family protein [Candidatus Omnitrophica bacterium]|nr:Trm112 family protein [Candidatus Omnitrophota bacterium]
MMLDKVLLEILACPICQADVIEKGDKVICTNADCGLKYPIQDGIPVLLFDEGKK